MNLEWHKEYTLPSVWKFYEPNRMTHGSYWQSWGSTQEIAWKENFRLWMNFINEYKNRGGRVTIGTDAAYIYNLYGFNYPREMELLQEAGFHPLEVIKAATLNGAQALGMDSLIGSIEVGKLADFVLIDQNPLEDLKVLYGIGALRLNEKNIIEKVGGVKYTIKDGIIYDAKKLLADVKKMVTDEKAKTGYVLKIPGQF
ncbi:MAG TPA: amidohydrolase family protein, partial [Chitinophagaceae bacterium]|nr:amidohydrolase family protein [Chitinophagaceae bacterium]